MVIRPIKDKERFYWCWQKHRVWVPYPVDVSRVLEQAFQRGTGDVQFTVREKIYTVSFTMDPDGYGPRPHQYRKGKPHIHREVKRRPVKTEVRYSHEEALTSHISFEDLQWMDIAHNKTRLLEHEMADGKLDEEYSLESVERALKLGARSAHWAQAQLPKAD